MSRVTPATATTTTPSTTQTGSASSQEEKQYPVKWVFNEDQISVPIVMQSANGPCALLALINALLLTGQITIHAGVTKLPESHLLSLLAEYASSQPPSENFEHHLQEFLDVLPTTSKGLHINVRFSGSTSFEYTKELSVFDVLKVRLVHGWLIDPQDGPLTAALASLSYNQVVNELVRTACPEAEEASAPPPEAFDDDTPAEKEKESDTTVSIRELRPCVLEFFEGNPTMLTVYGLTVLHETVKEGEMVILFRNSHFYCLRKRQGELYMLVTDVGYLNELNTVWEKLIDVMGDSVFYTGRFERIGADGKVVTSAAHPHTNRNLGTRPVQAGATGAGTTTTATGASATPTTTGVARTAAPVGVAAGSGAETPRMSGRYGRNSRKSEKCSIQ